MPQEQPRARLGANTAKMVEASAARRKKQSDKEASSPEAFGKNLLSNQLSSSGADGKPIDTVAKLLQTYQNNSNAFNEVMYVTVDGVEIAVDPIYNEVYLTISGENKMSLDKTKVGIKDGNGDKETYSYSDERQILQVRASRLNVNILPRESDDRSKVDSFQGCTIWSAIRRMKKSITRLEAGKGRDLQLCLSSAGTRQMMQEYKASLFPRGQRSCKAWMQPDSSASARLVHSATPRASWSAAGRAAKRWCMMEIRPAKTAQ